MNYHIGSPGEYLLSFFLTGGALKPLIYIYTVLYVIKGYRHRRTDYVHDYDYEYTKAIHQHFLKCIQPCTTVYVQSICLYYPCTRVYTTALTVVFRSVEVMKSQRPIFEGERCGWEFLYSRRGRSRRVRWPRGQSAAAWRHGPDNSEDFVIVVAFISSSRKNVEIWERKEEEKEERKK